MQLHSDFSERVVLLPAQQHWQPSPMPGVSRIMLDRAGGEVARATSLVRYAAGSGYHPHRHDGGEEILVLQGVLSDEHGDYPAGTYLRNPPGSSHSPFSVEGCLLLVKLWQFSAADDSQLVIYSQHNNFVPGIAAGLSVLPLHEFDGVSTALVRFAPYTRFQPHIHPGGEEILVLEGVFRDEFGEYPAMSWLRNPRYSQHHPYTGAEGALIYVKIGHLGANLLGDQFIEHSRVDP